MEIVQKFDLEEIELTENNQIIINNGERVLSLHPNMPKSIIEHYLRLTFNKEINGNSLVLSITDKCNIACDFCCHPYMNSEFSEVDAIHIVTEACKFGKFAEISLTGGEAFLRYDLLIKLAKICKRHNTLFGVITNGYWGNSEPLKKCKELVESGVGRITFSWDPSHGKFVSPETMMCCIDSAMEVGLKVTLTGSFKKKNDTHENYGFNLKHHKQYANFIQSSNNVIPIGRGTKLENLYHDEINESSIEQFRCPSIDKNDLTLYSKDGLAMPCCSVFSGYDLPQLSIGNWKEDSIESLFTNHMADGYYRIIKDFGFKHLYRIIKLHDLELFKKLPTMENCISSCELCSKLAIMEDFSVIRTLCNEYLDQIIIKKVAHLFQS